MNPLQWWRSGPPHRRLRRRLVVFSAPVVALVAVASLKAASVGIAGHSAVADFAAADAPALRDDVATLSFWNVAEPAKAHVAAGALALLENRLQDADREFSAALTRTDPSQSCPVSVDLELIRETLGDNAARSLDAQNAVDAYRAASAIVADAPVGCFAGNTDDDAQRRAIRNDAAGRLSDKIVALQSIPSAPRVPAVPPPPPPPPRAGGPPPGDSDAVKRLNPGDGDPRDRLRQILRDAAAGG